jgi:hypothetical protein
VSLPSVEDVGWNIEQPVPAGRYALHSTIPDSLLTSCRVCVRMMAGGDVVGSGVDRCGMHATQTPQTITRMFEAPRIPVGCLSQQMVYRFLPLRDLMQVEVWRIKHSSTCTAAKSNIRPPTGLEKGPRRLVMGNRSFSTLPLLPSIEVLVGTKMFASTVH